MQEFEGPGGAELTIDRDRDKNPVVALREIAEETVTPVELQDAIVGSLQRVQVDDDDTPDEIGSLAASAEAKRFRSAHIPRAGHKPGDPFPGGFRTGQSDRRERAVHGKVHDRR